MPPPSITFHCTLSNDGAMGAIPITFDQRAVFGRARPPVIVVINGYTYRSTISVMGGETFVPLRRSHREAAGLVGGETIAVTLTLDTAPREVDAPEALAVALDAAGLRARWDALSFTQRREDAEAVTGAKRYDTRDRRIAAIVARLAT